MHEVKKNATRPPAVADLFYPADPQKLDREISRLFEEVDTDSVAGDIKAIISPHAGYIYSGRIAAHAYKQLQATDSSLFVIIGPSHREAFTGVSVFSGKAYETPLGTAYVEQSVVRSLVKESDIIHAAWEGHGREHALEVQLPFIQKVVKNPRIVPIVMGDQKWRTCVELASCLSTTIQKTGAIIVATSDLSHYHSYDEAIATDTNTIAAIEAFDEKAFVDAIQEGRSEACGAGPILTAMLVSKKLGADTALKLQYGNSGDVSGERSTVVGYMSAIFYRQN